MKKLLLLFLLTIAVMASAASEPTYPQIGAEIFIEPGQTPQQIDQWFKVLSESGMNVCRIRMFESYMKDVKGNWDFSLFDNAFKAAEKYGIQIYATFFPETTKIDIGGWKFPESDAQLAQFAEYIKQATLHFNQYKSMYAWVLINEPGYNHREDAFTDKMRKEWKKNNPTPESSPNGYPVLIDFSEARFKTYKNTWMLNWIATEVRKYDKNVQLHVNPHAVFSLIKEYDFPQWRPFLNSLGGSAHASWHFGNFARPQYAMAMSANSEIIYSGAGKLPWLMTELQGGNITYSGSVPLCPTYEEITQWLWTILATEGKGGIFWMWNPRSSGIESGEWAMLDFQNQPTERVQAAGAVIKCARKNGTLLSSAKKYNSGINILYINESLLTEEKLGNGRETPPRSIGSTMNDMLGYFETLSQLGVTPNIKSIKEFDFSQTNYDNQTIILANQIAIPQIYVDSLTNFVSKGGKLLVDGLTGFYDENAIAVMATGFPFKNLFGGEISEFKYQDKPFTYKINTQKEALPGLGWKSNIKPLSTSQTLMAENGETRATRNKVGKGEVVWLPTLLGYGARLYGGVSLAKYLYNELNLYKQPFVFQDFQPLVSMKTLKTSSGYITVIINKSSQTNNLVIKSVDKSITPTVLFADKNGLCTKNTLKIAPEETMVIEWK